MCPPEPSLLDQAEAAHTAQTVEQEWRQADDREHLQQRGFERGLELLARLVPAVLGLPFETQNAQLHQLHHTAFTASTVIEGRTFRPMLYTREGHSLSDEHVDRLEVLIPQARWSRCRVAWLPVKNLAQLVAALAAEKSGSILGYDFGPVRR